MTILILVLYLLVLVFIAIRSFNRINNYSDFFIARKKGNYLTITGSLVATILGGSAVIGAIDAGKTMGWATSWFMLSAAIGLFALLPLSKKINRIGRNTLPDLLEDLYGKRTKFFASVIIPLAWLGIVAAQLIASALILQSFTGMSYSLGVILSGVVFIGYTVVGGQLSVLKTDFVQAILIVLGLILLVVFSAPHINQQQMSQFPLSFPFNVGFKPLDLFVLIITYSSTFTAGPDIYSRIFCAENEQIAKKSVLTTALILIPIALMIGYLSVYGATHTNLNFHGASIVEISQQVLPMWALPFIVIALLSAVLSSADTTLLSASIIVTDLISKGNFNSKTISKTRIVILITGMLSVFIALNFSSVIDMLLMALTVYSGAFILPIIFGLANLKVKPAFASAAIMVGGITALVGKLMIYSDLSAWSNQIIILAFAFNALLLTLGRKPKE